MKRFSARSNCVRARKELEDPMLGPGIELTVAQLQLGGRFAWWISGA